MTSSKLSRLQVNIEGVTQILGPVSRVKRMTESDRLDAICVAVQSRMQGLEYTIVEAKDIVEFLQLVLTLQS